MLKRLFTKSNPEATPLGVLLWAIPGIPMGACLFWYGSRSIWIASIGAVVGACAAALAHWQLED
jgi:hypothetical protein